ncbi:MAG: hypothetical protein ACRD08_00765 [Acidimicrobiales bacterium]
MDRRLLSPILAAAACTSGTPPAGAPAPAGTPAAVYTPGTDGRATPTIRLGPSTLRYVVQRQLHIEQDFGGQPPVDMSYRLFVTATVVGPSDSTGYPASYTVDSVVADSGSFIPPTVNLATARGLAYRGRLTPAGELQGLVPSDSATAQRLAQLLGNPRDFYPRIPPGGLQLGADWTDTVSTSEKGPGTEVQITAITHSTAVAWDTRAGTRALRVEYSGIGTLAGSGEQGGQPFELSGGGTRSGTEYVAADGRFLGGEMRDSTGYTVILPAQGLSVPVRQVLRATVTVLP